MKQTLKNSKGFTLVELLVVIAILGVLAVIAFQAFSGVIENSKVKADQQTARQIEKAIKMLCVDTGLLSADELLTGTKISKAKTSNTALDTAKPISTGKTAQGVKDLIISLQDKVYTKDKRGQVVSHGPYLEIIGALGYEGYTPQSQLYRDNGYTIELKPGTREVIVNLVEKGPTTSVEYIK